MRLERYNKISLVFFLFAVTILLLTGCAYPKQKMIQNSAPPLQQIKMVQDAVDAYRKDTGVLPIETKDATTPEYERYPVDFSRIVPKYIPYIPGTAFEAGGSYMFILLHAEEKPEVRLIDLNVSQKVQTVQEKVTRYYTARQTLPLGKKLADGFYAVDYDKLRMQEETYKSPFSQQELPFVINDKGIVGIDYAMDLSMALRSTSTRPKPGEDIRYILVAASPLAPVKSFSYHLVNGEPQLVKEN
jgi:hypothetical protein